LPIVDPLILSILLSINLTIDQSINLIDAMPKATESTIILQRQDDWELWFFVVQRIAKAANVWKYINPDQANTPLQEPEKPTRPSATINADGSTTQPTPANLDQFNQDINVYYKEIKEYSRLTDKLGQVEAHIMKTIHQDLLYHIKDQSTVYDQIKILQSLYSPTKPDQEYRVHKAYEAAKILHARRTNIED
jgi:hypothetical protein